jgi:hypothetical protein
LIKNYQEIIDQIKSVDLTDKSDEYKKSFWGSMNKVVSPLESKKQSFIIELNRQIKSHSIMSELNLDVINPDLANKIYPRLEYLNLGAVMDRVGRN